MNNKDPNKKLIDLINYTIADTNYVKDFATPYYGIFKTLLYWISMYTISSFILFFYQYFGNLYSLYLNNWYFPLSRLLNIFLFSMSLLVYFIYIFKNKMSLKEKDFLKSFSIIVIMLVFSRMVFALSYYIKSSILVDLYNTIPLDIIILILSGFYLNYYFKSSFSRGIIIMNIVIFILNILVFSLFTSTSNPSSILISIHNLFTILRDNGVFIILNFFILLTILYKLKKNENEE